jgi:serine/threonine-protein kinase 24/25/MST4
MQAKAALQAGLRKGNAREKPIRYEKGSHEHRSSGVNSQEVQRYFRLTFTRV